MGLIESHEPERGWAARSVDNFCEKKEDSPRMQTFEHFAGLKDEAKLADISCRMWRGRALGRGRTANLWH